MPIGQHSSRVAVGPSYVPAGLLGTTGSLSDRSGATVAAAAPATIMQPRPGRRYLFVQNIDQAGNDLWVNVGSTATAGSASIWLQPGQSYSPEGQFIPDGAVSVQAAVAGVAYVAKEG